eukprot:GCRY01002506.1.p1 GENE.GCRY01002506.1~~GCRY01002506.1.p1  ORF type:complete len:577 (+),score=132.97 GCRY01002506.1:282-2012(+)
MLQFFRKPFSLNITPPFQPFWKLNQVKNFGHIPSLKERDQLDYDVVIVGAGPAGLSAALKLKQQNSSTSVCVIEKAAEIGAHTLSGAIIETNALDELIPSWKELNCPLLEAPVSKDQFRFLTAKSSIPLPVTHFSRTFRNKGNYVGSLGRFVAWLAEQAEAAGVEIYPGFAGDEPVYSEDGQLRGVQIKDVGLSKDGVPKDSYEPGVVLAGNQIFLAEGCRGSITKKIVERYHLNADASPQQYGLGVKELWQVPAEAHHLGAVTHTLGFPLQSNTYGGGFIYHMPDNLVAVGLVVALDYTNPTLSPFAELQRLKTHPHVARILAGGQLVSYGAKSLCEGGVQAVGLTSFPGGVLIGDGVGLMNVPKIKGTHTAMKSGMLAADAYCAAPDSIQLSDYDKALKQSWVWKELQAVRNCRPAFRWGLLMGLAVSGLEITFTRGHMPVTLRAHHEDHAALRPLRSVAPKHYPPPDKTLTFDRTHALAFANVAHEEDQPCHLHLKDTDVPTSVNYDIYGGPEELYCPAGVYEYLETPDANKKELHINASNCIHCKTCDIKDPTQNIDWSVPEGGGGPLWGNM